MNRQPHIELDGRDTNAIVRQLMVRRQGYVLDWFPPENSASQAIAKIFARYLHCLLKRLNLAPAKNKLAFLDLLGIEMVPARSAVAPIVFELSPEAPDTRAPAGTQVAAPPPPDGDDQIVFETQNVLGLTSAALKEVYSLWPGRDQYIDHSAAYEQGETFYPFNRTYLKNIAHEIYIAHDRLLALAGSVTLDLFIDLAQASSEELDILWEFWDGTIWRTFRSAFTDCSKDASEKQDRTAGLTQSGFTRLQASGVEAVKKEVNGVEAYWIRGRLAEPLVSEEGAILPELSEITLSSVIEHPLSVSLDSEFTLLDGQGELAFDVRTATGQPVTGRTEVVLTGTSGDEFKAYVSNGSVTFNNVIADNYRLEFLYRYKPARLEISFSDTTSRAYTIVANLEGLELDNAVSEGVPLDLSKAFYPFGASPQPGAAFYFSSQELFSKPGATVEIYVETADSPQSQVSLGQPTPSEHTVAWEYWNGREWVLLSQVTTDTTDRRALTETGIIRLVIPEDMEHVAIADEEALWMRCRLVSGGFGKINTVEIDGQPFNSYIPQPPIVNAIRIGYHWEDGRHHAEQLLTRNDFQFEDRTDDARWPGISFPLFTKTKDVTPALYLGFDKALPVDFVGLYLDIAEKKEETEGPALLWEYWDNSAWRELMVEDETQDLRVPGLVSFIGPSDSVSLARFSADLHWVRARLAEDGPPGEPEIKRIYKNAVAALQRQTLNDAPLGTSNGTPKQSFGFPQVPVLEDERVEVCELSGRRASVEWRLLVLELAGGDQRAVTQLENLLSNEDPAVDVVWQDVRLTRDRLKNVTEAWVRWEGKPHLFFSGPEDRHYTVSRSRGLFAFGDGENGKIPEPGAKIMIRRVQVGGGLFGNVEARTITSLLGSVAGVAGVTNPRAAEGGADGETLENYGTRAPRTVRHRGDAVLASDYETMAFEASPAVAFARVIPTRDASSRRRPGWVTVLIIPQSKEPRPQPSFGLREQVRKYIEKRNPATVGEDRHVFVCGPEYIEVDVEATIAPNDPAQAGEVENRVRSALEHFLHPIHGGPGGLGFELGRDVYLSDVATVLERVEGVDYVEALNLALAGVRQDERVRVPDDRIVVCGDLLLKMKAQGAERGNSFAEPGRQALGRSC